MRTTRVLAAALPFIATGAALGADANPIASPLAGAMPAITALVVFVAVMLIAAKFIWPKINAGLAEREEKIRSNIEAAELAQEQAKEALDQYEQNLAEARSEAQKMRDEAKQQAQALAAELKAKAEGELNAMRDRAKRDIEAARKTAVADVYSEAATLATSIAAKILQREISADDQRRLVEESLAELQTVSAS